MVTDLPPRPNTAPPSSAPHPEQSQELTAIFEDEAFTQDDFEDDGVSQGGDAQMEEPRAAWVRPNNREYIPRYLGGYQDCAFLRYARTQKEHTYFYGPPGTGKGALVEAAFFPDAQVISGEDGEFSRSHNGIYTLIGEEETAVADFVGNYVQDPHSGLFQWVHGPLTLAVLDDVPLFVDEILLIDPKVLSSVLYPLMDGRNILHIPSNPTLPPIPVGPGFCVIGAGNPDVVGAKFSEALRDRFDHHIEIRTDWELAKSLGVPAWIVRVARELDEERARGTITWSPQMRALEAFRNHERRYGTAYAVAALVGKAPEEDRVHIVSRLKLCPEVKASKVKALRLGGKRPGTL